MALHGDASLQSHSESMMCVDCFYKLRHDPDKVKPLLGRHPCPGCRKRRIHVVLKGNVYETTYVREKLTCDVWPVKCTSLKYCGGDQCLYVHGDEELEVWKETFESTSGTNRPHQSLMEKMKPPRPPPLGSNDSQYYASEWPDFEDTEKESNSFTSSEDANISTNISTSNLLRNSASKALVGASNSASIDRNSLPHHFKSSASKEEIGSSVSVGRYPVDAISTKSASSDVNIRNTSMDTSLRIAASNVASNRNTSLSQQHSSMEGNARWKGNPPLSGTNPRGAKVQSRTQSKESDVPVRNRRKYDKKSTTPGTVASSASIRPNEKLMLSVGNPNSCSRITPQLGHFMISQQECKKYAAEKDEQNFTLTETLSNYMKFSSDLDTFDFSQPLTCETYKERFHRLLFLEERERASQLAMRCNKEYDIVFCKGKGIYGNSDDYIAYIDAISSDSDPLAYAKQASISSTICISGNTMKVNHIPDAILPQHIQANANFYAIVFRHTREHRKNLGLHDEERRFKGQVIFEAEKNYFGRMHKAVDNLPEAAIQKILPERKRFQTKYVITSSKLEWPPLTYDKGGKKNRQMELDYEQLDALRKILSLDPALPLIILGPFGTGKTRLLARSAYNIVCDGDSSCRPKVLLVAHHQSSADTLANHFLTLGSPYIRVIRVCKLNEYRKYSGRSIEYVPVNKIPDGGNFLNEYDVVVTTLGTSSSLLFKVKRHLKVGYFTHILIDEAAQTREPEAIIPLCFAGNETKIVLAGDHCQVGPRLLVSGKKAQECGLQVSLLERLHRLYSHHRPQSDEYTASLIKNYRCVPEILMLPSNLYYESSLHCEVPNSKDSWYPLQFICSSVKDVDSSHDSCFEEADIVLNKVKEYMSWPGHGRASIVSPSPTQSDNPALAEASQDGEVEDRMKIYEQKEVKTDLLPDSTLLANIEDEKIKELTEEAEVEDDSLYAYPMLSGINVVDNNKNEILGFSSQNTISFTYNGEKGCLNWKENDLVLLFEDSDLPLEDAKCPLLVSVGEAGAFRYPDKVEPASKVYHIHCPKNLHASVKIRIYHDVPEHNIQHLCFVTCSEDQPPYDYAIIHGGNFTAKYGEVDIRKFSMYALGLLIRYNVKGLLSIMEKSYVASMYRSLYPRHNSSGFSWNIYISAVKNCSIFKRLIQIYIKEEYKDDVELISTDVVRFNASESNITAITTCEPNLHEVGSLKPLVYPSLRKIDISRFVDARPPHIKFVLVTKPHCPATSMNIKFTLQGLEEPNNFITLHHFIPEWSPPCLLRATSTTRNEERFSTISAPSMIFPAPADRNRSFSSSGSPTVYDFTLKNLTLLECERTRCKVHLIDEIKSKWKIASDLLGLTISRTEGIEKDNHSVQECCRSLIAEWLTNVDGIYVYPPSWEGLCNLLNDMNLSALSEQVRNIVFRSEF